MASPSSHVPRFIENKDKTALIKQLLSVQGVEGGRVHIISINFDTSSKTWVLWYYPIESFGTGLL